jgi:hypothetical protein
MKTTGFLLKLQERVSMHNRTLKAHGMEAIIWGLIVAIILTVGGTPMVFSFVVGIIFCGVAVFVLDTEEAGEILRQ